MSRKSFATLFAGLILGAVLNSGFFNEAEQIHQAKIGWCADVCK